MSGGDRFGGEDLTKKWGDVLYGLGGVAWTKEFSFTGALEVSVGKSHIYNDVGRSLQIVKVRATLDTAPVGSSAIFDVFKNGVSIYTTTANRPTIPAGGSGPVTVVATLPDDVLIAPDDEISASITQIGSTTSGSDLLLQITATAA